MTHLTKRREQRAQFQCMFYVPWYPPGVDKLCRHTAREIMVSITTAFIVHGVVGFIFCLPVFMMGLRGFIDVGPHTPAGAAACDAPQCRASRQLKGTTQCSTQAACPVPPRPPPALPPAPPPAPRVAGAFVAL